ncbi:T9SS type A sorting domain-containing protein [Gaetbulibacter sp. M235]|uniref:T9SS type A sorting domain-containing protein n=1 Tax=Gaetbulibacter sp. M235 TaxID=3126510 RepID=UPI00374F8C85
MKTKLPTLILALFSFVAYSQTTYVPDNNFEAYLEANGMGDGVANNDYVTTANISSVTNLDVHSNFISDMTGIEDFASLQILDCSSNNLIALNLLNNTALTEIKCFNNNIGNGGNNLILPNNNILTYLNCGDNNLSGLNVSAYPLLDYLACYNNASNLGALDFSLNPNLRELYCHNSGVSSLNISQNVLLEKLWCYGNSLTSLNITPLTALTELICYTNGLNNFTYSNNTSLIYLDCGDNPIGSLNASMFPNIETLYCYYDNLSSLDVSSNNSLISLDCGGNTSINSLPLPNTKTNLVNLWAYEMNLSTLSYDEYTQLQKLDIGINNFTSADVSMLPNLTQFYCNQNQLTSLNIANGNIDNLAWMWAQDNSTGLCIQVDDLAKATAKSSPNWQRDSGSTFSLNCSLGTDDFNLSSVSIYPNPFNDKFYVNVKLEANYTLTNMLGQKVNRGILNTGINELATNTLVSGLYLLNIQTTEGFSTKKLIKE